MPRDGDGAGAALAEATATLYAAVPEEFVGTRTLLVAELKAAGDGETAKEVGRLRRPTTAAWAVNRTVRERPDQAERLGEVGEQLREAQARLDAARLRDLRPEREGLLHEFLAAATSVAEEAGRALAPAVLEEVRATLVAALASESATEAVVSGSLTRALAYSGFGDVDLSEAVARTSSGAVLTVVGTGGSRAQATAPRVEETGRAAETGRVAKTGRAAGAGTERAGTVTSETAKKGIGPAESARETTSRRETKAGRGAEAAREERAVRRAEAIASAEAVLAQATTELDAAERVAVAARQRAKEAREHVHEVEAALTRARAEHRAAEEAATEAVRARTAALAARHTAERALTEIQRSD